RLIEFLPDNTRLYAEDALAYARPEFNTPQRRYAARTYNSNYVKIAELANRNRFPTFTSIQRFTMGRGGTTDSSLCRLPDMLNAEIGYLLGLIASDGYLGKRGRVGLVNTDLTLHKLFAEMM